MAFLRAYGKSIMMVLALVVSGVVAGLQDGSLTGAEGINIVIQALGACAVFTAAQVPGAKYTKVVLAVLTAAATAAASYVAGGFDQGEVFQIIIAAVGALMAVFAPAVSTTGIAHGAGAVPPGTRAG